MGLTACALLLLWLFEPSRLGWPAFCLAAILSWLSVCDLERRILPDFGTLGLLGIGLLTAASTGPAALLASASGAAIAYLALSAIVWAYRQRRGVDGLGGGDVKLAATGGAWVGALHLPYVILVASVTGLIFVVVRSAIGPKRKLDERLTFGPFIAAAIWVVWLVAGGNGA